MDFPISFSEIENKVILIRDQQVIIDRDVAELYGVETKRVNEAVKNNPDKFPEGYVFNLQDAERQQLVEIFDRFKNLKHSTASPIAFTEKGLYMLATILKSPNATQTTIAIVEAFANLRELARTISNIAQSENEEEQQALLQKSGILTTEILGNSLTKTDTETSIELNLAMLKFKHTIRRRNED